MKPCCIDAEQRCVDIGNPWDEWWCESVDGVLGPAGACCEYPTEGDCTASDPDHRCWRCPWEVPASLQQIEPCCLPELGWQFFPVESGFMRGQCMQCDGRHAASPEECAPPVSERAPCCTAWGACRNLSQDETWRCLTDWNGTLGPVGTCCQNPEEGYDFDCHLRVAPEHVCWRCDWALGEMASPCCFADLDHRWVANTPWEQCWACGGEIMDQDALEEECTPPAPEPECIDAPRADRPNPTIIDDEGTRLQWTLDTIGTVVFGRSATDDVLRGYQYPISTHLIRPKQADTPAESCGHAGGRMTMLDDGYVYVETCSKPDRTSEDSFRRSYGLMRTFLPETNTPVAQHNRLLGMQDGYQYSVACIRLPWWTEATYRSHMARCGSDPI